MPAIATIHEFLRTARIPYTVVPRPEQEDPVAARIPGRQWAKVVVCVVDGEPIDAVVPAALSVHLDRLLELSGGRDIRLAGEEEEQRRRQAVFVDVSLAAERDVVFSVGTHVDAIAIRWADFARAVKPIVGNFAAPPRDRVPAYRLSYRE
jgi:prolyl-tRNA editing enzyme YbaK/EbsC (Cys-tRNA(Pro) deacylase)